MNLLVGIILVLLLFINYLLITGQKMTSTFSQRPIMTPEEKLAEDLAIIAAKAQRFADGLVSTALVKKAEARKLKLELDALKNANKRVRSSVYLAYLNKVKAAQAAEKEAAKATAEAAKIKKDADMAAKKAAVAIGGTPTLKPLEKA